MYSIPQIQKAFKHRIIANKVVTNTIIKTVQLLPDDMIDFVTQNCWFISSFEDGWAFVLKGDDLKPTEYLIFLSDELVGAGERQMRYTILHEVGHVVLGHRNSFHVNQTKSEIKKQEHEADKFAREFILLK